MSRVALIGENSIAFISTLIDIWNNGDCAVLIDCQMPSKIVMDMLLEAEVEKCYIERKYYDEINRILDKSIELIPYEKENTSVQLLPMEIYDKFHENYSADEAIVIYSSGTTGKSKGIILSHFAINTNADAILDYMQLDAHDLIYIVKNLTHSSTITGELLVSLKTRTHLLIAPVIVPPRYVLMNIEKFGVTIIGTNPLLLSLYCSECINRKYDLSTLKKIYVSGSILRDKIYEMAHDVFYNQKIYNVYGLSEAGPRVTAQRYDCCKGNSVGKKIKGVEIAITDEYGNIITRGKRGIVHVNTPSRFIKYVCGEEKHQTLYNNWLNTGDIGYIDEYDELHIVGRTDDVIIIGAHKIYPFEVERKIQINADISECVVAMVSFQEEDILCCLYVSDKEIRKDIKNVLSTILLNYEIPKLFIQTKAIPKTQNGKISMNNVRENIIRKLRGRINE